MIDTVQKVMDENARRRQIEADLNEELGIQDRKQLGHEKHDLYDQALSQRINEAVLSPKQKSLAAIGDDPKKIDASDFAKLRGMKNEANEEPPFEPDAKKSTPWKNPQSKAKNLAREMMKKMKDKAAKDTQKTFPNVKHLTPAGNPDWHKHGYKDMPIKEEEQIDEERKRTSAVSSAFLAGKPAKQKELQTNGQEMTYHGNVIAKHAGDEVHVTTAGYGHSPSTRAHINGVLNRLGAPGLSQKKGKLMHGDTEVGTRDWIKIKKPTATMSEEQIDEVLDSKMSKLRYMVKSIGSIVKNRGNLDVDHTDKDARRTLTKRKEGYNLVQKKLGPNPIAKRMPTMNALEENTSLESIQEEIRNNLLERANRLLEHGNQEQIVEFMNDLTMEQRSILNMQEAARIGRGFGVGTRRPPVAANDNLAAPPSVAPSPGITGRDIGAAAVGAAAATLGNRDSAPAATPASRAPVGDQERSDADNNSNNKLTAAKPAAAAKPAGPAVPLPTARPASASATPAAAPAAAASPAPRASAPRASAPAAARPEIRRTGEGGAETAQDFNYNQANGAYNEPKAAAAPRAARAAAPAAAAANKPAAASAAATSATSVPKRSGSDIGSSVAGGDDRLAPANKPEPSVSSFEVPTPSKTAGMPDDAQAASDSGIHGMGTPSPTPSPKPAAASTAATSATSVPKRSGSDIGSSVAGGDDRLAPAKPSAAATSFGRDGTGGFGLDTPIDRSNPKDKNNLEESRNFERFLRNR